MRKFVLMSSAAFAVAVFAVPAMATSLDGSLTFGGGPTNYFNPANGFVPGGYGNSTGANGVTVGGGVEFGFNDLANFDTADFSATGFTLLDVGAITAGAGIFEMKFTADDAYFSNVSLVSDTFGGTWSVVGNVFTYSAPAVSGITTRQAVFSIGAPGVPEPASWAMMIGGFALAGSVLRRKTLSVRFA